MVEFAEYQPGTPCWVELWTADRPASMDFYAAVFRWHYQVGPESQHFFTVAQLKDKSVAGLITPPGNPNAPMIWVTYLAVADLDATLAAVAQHGGQSLTGAIQVPDSDVRVALLMDSTGVLAGAWESRQRRGAELANEPGTQIWNELWTSDPAAARTFYAAVFGIEIGDQLAPDFDYTTFLAGGRIVGGIGALPDGAPRWNTYFGVTDTDATAALVRQAGGTVAQIRDSQFGRIAVCADPQGTEFFLIPATAADDA